jgi:hypothetical protein
LFILAHRAGIGRKQESIQCRAGGPAGPFR